ncbi:MAG: hypothetical protein LKCHEGNO_03322 [Burkholderiaceae bacterium]|nr:hypothetical protein [Burkholderiaceae bacterium]
MTRSNERRTRPGKLADPQAKPRRSAEPEAAPLSITLRDIEVPPAPAAPSKPAGEEFIVSDPEARHAPWLGDPEAERAAQRAARRAQVRKDRLRDAGPATAHGGLDDAPAASALPTLSEALPPTLSEALPPTLTETLPPTLTEAPALKPAAPEPQPTALPTLTEALSPPAAPPADAVIDATPEVVPSAPPRPAMPTAPAAAGKVAHGTPAEPAKPAVSSILVLREAGNEPDPLCEQLRAFGFDVQVRREPPDLPAPWPFVAVFVDQALHPADGGDAMDLCNDVRERSRLPGVLKPVLVLVASELSATNRVRAGLAGCNEILLGAITRGAVAKVLDTRGIALPSDARRT